MSERVQLGNSTRGGDRGGIVTAGRAADNTLPFGHITRMAELDSHRTRGAPPAPFLRRPQQFWA